MKKTAKLLALVLILCTLILPVLTACNDGEEASSGDRLVVYNWEDYIDESVIREFEAYYKDVTGRSLNVIYTTYDTNETMMTKIFKNDANVDLICPSEYSIEKLMLTGNGYLVNMRELYTELQPQIAQYGLNLSSMSSLKLVSDANDKAYGNIEPAVMDVISSMFSSIKNAEGTEYDMTEYMVPYMWGTLGILYNTKVVSLEELEQHGWGVLWNVQNNPRLENKILMKDSVRDTYAASVLYMKGCNLLPDGYQNLSIQELINCTDKAVLDAAERVLTEQRAHISGYEVDFGKDDMINEIVYADFAWSGDALYAIEEGDYYEDTDTYQLGYYVPSIGSNIWYDGWCIPKTVKNKLAAMMFIDFMCRPSVAIRNSLEIGYTSAVSKQMMQSDAEALQYIIDCYTDDSDSNKDANGDIIEYFDPTEYFDNEARYPEINENLGVMRDFGALNDTVVHMWQRAKAGGKVDTSLWYILLVIIGAIGLALGAYFAVQALRLRPRKIK